MAFWSKSKSAKDAAPKDEPAPKAEEQRTWFSVADAPRPMNGTNGMNGTPLPQPQPQPQPQPETRTQTGQAAAASPMAGLPPVGTDAARAAAQQPADPQRANTERSRQFAIALGQIATVAMHSNPHQALTLAEFRARVVPALLSGQFVLASRRDERLGAQTPVTAVLWACVSDAVDLRLTEGGTGEIRLDRSEWCGGPHIWLVDVFGDPGMLPELLRKLRETKWQHRAVKMFVRDGEGRASVRVIAAA